MPTTTASRPSAQLLGTPASPGLVSIVLLLDNESRMLAFFYKLTQQLESGSMMAFVARFLACCCVLAAIAQGQTLRGIVVDTQGAAIAGAEVTARNSAKVQHSVSGPDGQFSFSQITPPADVSAAKAGFAAGAVKW